MSSKSEEKKVLAIMIEIFCKGKHGSSSMLCADCSDLLEYAKNKLDDCPFKNKPNCSDCKIQCYDVVERDGIRNVMRYSGKRMVIKHPIKTIAHYLKRYS